MCVVPIEKEERWAKHCSELAVGQLDGSWHWRLGTQHSGRGRGIGEGWSAAVNVVGSPAKNDADVGREVEVERVP